MSSDSNNMTHNTTFHPSEPAPCANGCGFFGGPATNGCGFFGGPATNGFCSKCFRDVQTKVEQAASVKATVYNLVNKVLALPVEPDRTGFKKTSNRCLACNKKVGVIGFKCKCGEMFCGSHRYPEKHACEFDYKRTGREAIARANPVIKADKVDRI